jgi:DNA-binding NtrC family response regulator
MRLAMHSWPGNVRELENVIGHACMMTLGDTIDVQDLPSYLQSGESAQGAAQEPLMVGEADSGIGTLEEQEKQLIMRAMQSAAGNQSQAARSLRIGRDALRYKLKKHNL